MGNQLAQLQKVQPDHLADIPNLVLKEHLGGGRFLKTVLCVHDEGGQVVVKVYSKRGDVDIDKYAQQLLHIRSRLSGLPGSHVWPFQRFFHTDKAAYLIQQHIFSNLYHRLSTRPFLASVEKHWIAFQLLHAVAQSHEQGICHGDIKCENVLVTSWHWIFLADFASYKPTYLPADNPADFSFFFDTGGRRRCYLAPERFYAAEAAATATFSDAPVQPAMDIFSLGCVIAELFLEGQRLFDLSELLAYKRGEFSPEVSLAKVEEPFRQLVLHMINVDPGARLSAAEYLRTWGPSLFPAYFGSLLHPFFCSLLPMDPDARIQAVQRDFHILVETIMGREAAARLRRPAFPAADAGEDASLEAQDEHRAAHASSRSAGSAAVQRLAQEASDLAAALDQRAPPADLQPSVALAPQPDGCAPAKGRDDRTVVVEEAMEFQCRDRGRAFGEASTSGRLAAQREWQPPATRRKEDIALPPEPGWQWTDEWRVDRESSPTDGRGWAYLASSGSQAPPQWLPSCKLDCLWRRRRWTRQRRKLQPHSRLALQQLGRLGQDAGDAQGMVIVATLLCSTVRGARLQECKAQAIALLTETAGYCDDDTRLQRIVPYLMECMKVPMASVRCAALQGLVPVLALTESLPPSDAKVFPEYILPSLSLVPNDKEEWLRAAYAAAIGPLALSAQRLLDRLRSAGAAAPATVRCEAEAQELRVAVERVVSEVVLGGRSTAATRRALLSTVVELAGFLGRRDSNDFLLPILMTFLNSPDWQLRSDFFASAAALRPSAGTAGVEAYLLPCLLQALGDRQHAVVARAVEFLAALTEAGHLRRRSLLAVLSAAKGRQVLPALLHHESAGVRAAAALFAASAARQLSPAEAFTFLRPRLLPALAREPADMRDAAAIVTCLPERSGSGRPAPGQERETSAPHGSAEMQNGGTGRQEQPSLLVPANAQVYSVKLRRPAAAHDESALKAALASSVETAGAASAEDPSHMSAQRLLAGARRLPRATAEMASVHGRLASGLQIGGEEALSFQADALRTPPASVSASVSSAMDAAIHTHLPTHASASSSAHWRPRGLMVTHLAEHRKAVNRLAVAGGGAFLASASSDETVKIWDCRRLERDVAFRSRLTYTAQGGSILACTEAGDGQSMASGSSNGSLHVWRVEYTTRPGGNPDRYTGLTGVRQECPDEGAILEVARWGALLLYASQAGRLHALDLRAKGDAWALRLDASQGCWPALAVDSEGSNWLLCGSTRGRLALWDMRFQVCVKSWQHADKLPIRALTPALAAPRRLGLLRLGATCPLVYASAGPNEVGLWDVEHARCHQVLRVQPLGGGQPGAGQAAPPAAASAADQLAAGELQLYADGVLEGTQALLPTAAGPLLTGSNDGCIRCWDAAHIDQSYIASGPPYPLDKGAPAIARTGVGYGQRLAGGVHVVEEVPVTRPAAERAAEPSTAGSPEERRAAISHADAVLHLAELHSLGERLLLSAGADGVIKAWK